MTIFEVLGTLWLVLVGLRAPTLTWESRVMYRLFRTRYTKKQAVYVTLRYVWLPGLLMAPGIFLIEGLDTFKPARLEDIKSAAIHLDRLLQQRAQPPAEEQ